MALFVIYGIDKKGGLETRMATRPAHIEHVNALGDGVKVGGPLLGASGDMAGTVLIIDVPDRAAAQAFADNDPYVLAGLFERVEIHEFKLVKGDIA